MNNDCWRASMGGKSVCIVSHN